MIRLGDAWVSIERREIFCAGMPVRLGSRAFNILEVLLATPNRVVTKDELIAAAWPDTVVEENNLHVHISALRKTICLSRDLLETVPGRGYRLNLMRAVENVTTCAIDVPEPALPASLQPNDTSVHVIDDEPAVRAALVRQLRAAGITATGYASAKAFMQACMFDVPGCLLLDVRLSDSSGFDLQDELARRDAPFPIVFMTGYGTIDMSVRAIKAGAQGFLTKPMDEVKLLAAVNEAMAFARVRHARCKQLNSVKARYETLSERERQVFSGIIEGRMNKDIAAQLGLQEVTIKVHKKHMMTKLEARTLVDLLRMGRLLQKLTDDQLVPTA